LCQGALHIFLGSIVAYSNNVKINALGVKSETLKTYGAVSEQIVIEMAQGVRKKLDSDYSIAVTGVAGPEGGSEGKPVGLVYIAIDSRDSKTQVYKYIFKGDRETIKKIASMEALVKLWMNLKEV